MVSTRHHPRAFPAPASPTSTTTSSSRPAPSSPPPPSTARRAASRKRKSILPVKTEEDEIEEITKAAVKEADNISEALALSSPPTTRSHTGASTRAKSPSTRSSRPSRARSHASFEHNPPPILIPWLLLSIPLVIWDTGYVLGRPYTMPGGGFWADTVFKPYGMYGTVDYMYGFPAWEAKNGFTAAQASMNAIETALYAYYLYVVSARVAGGDGFFRGFALKSFDVFSRRDGDDKDKIVVLGGTDVALAVVLCFASNIMTVSKTVLYWFNEYWSGWAQIGHNGFWHMLMWIVLNGAWIAIPAYVCWIMGSEIVEGLTTKKGGRGRTRDDD